MSIALIFPNRVTLKSLVLKQGFPQTKKTAENVPAQSQGDPHVWGEGFRKKSAENYNVIMKWLSLTLLNTVTQRQKIDEQNKMPPI